MASWFLTNLAIEERGDVENESTFERASDAREGGRERQGGSAI